MASPFPSLRISPEDFHRKPYQVIAKARSPEGGRIATVWNSGIVWSFTVNLTSEDELDALNRHWTEAAGDTFTFSCPDQGGEHLVEYDQEELDIERTGPTTHRCSIALRSVNG
jgi:hypothetical protein